MRAERRVNFARASPERNFCRNGIASQVLHEK
jgi:hypothetical protein